MHSSAAKAYRRVDAESAPKPQLLDLLYGRLLVDIDTARTAIVGRDIKGKAAAIDHAIQIVTELQCALDHAAAPDLCANLSSLYDYMMSKMTHASAFLEVKHLDEVAAIATQLRQAFADAAAGKSAPTEAPTAAPAPSKAPTPAPVKLAARR